MRKFKSSECVALTPAQLQVWTGQQLEPGNPLYNMAVAITISGLVDADRLRSSWKSVLIEFPWMNARICEKDGEWRQCICEDDIAYYSLDMSEDSKTSVSARAFFQAETERAFDLRGNLLAVWLARLDSESWIWYMKVHHVISDAWTFKVLWKRLNYYYSSKRPGLASVSRITAQYDQYVKKTHRFFDADINSERQLKYWKDRSPKVPSNIYTRNRLPSTTKSVRKRCHVSIERRKALESMAEWPEARSIGKNLSRFHVLLTVLFAYLGRITGDSALTIGAPIAHRSDKTSVNTPGLFMEVMPIQIEFDPEQSFFKLLSKVRGEVYQYHRNAQPGACAVVRSANINVIFNYINSSFCNLNDYPIDVEWMHSGHADQQHKLRVQVTDWTNSGEVALDFDLNESSFPVRRNEELLEHWWALYDAMYENPDQSVGSVGIVGRDALSQMQAILNLDWPQGSSTELILDRIRDVAIRKPQCVAVKDERRVMTYAELDALSSKIAANLRSTCVVRHARIGIYLPRSVELVVCVLAVLKCDAAYVPIESSHPGGRVDYIVDDAEMTAVITEQGMVNNISEKKLVVLYSTLAETACDTESIHRLNSSKPVGSSTAYILYTSGSTGQPKGVVVSHKALANYLNWAAAFYCPSEPLVFPLFTRISFDLTITSLFVPLMTGGQIRVYPESDTNTDLSILDVVRDDEVDIVKLTPSHLSLLQNQDLSQSRISQLIVGGEDLKRDLVIGIRRAFADRVRIHNEYGPTESTVGCIVHTFEPEVDEADSIPIGKPITGVAAFVLNSQLQHQPFDVAGELYLSGLSLADGYWNRPTLSESHFLTVSFDNDRIPVYRTGDVASISDSGVIEFLGRQDDQVKIRGSRIEISEIEAACLNLAGINHCSVTVFDPNPSTIHLPEKHCTRCGLSSRYPDSYINSSGVCQLCLQFEKYKQRAMAWFGTLPELEKLAAQIRQKRVGQYDCIMLLSGGKDSSYALARLVDMGLSVLAYTLDNGYISDQAKNNIHRVCSALDVDHRFGETESMNIIFADSLNRYSNVCNGCFKVLYTLSLALAKKLEISTIFTGLSRGQFFETRLTEELFTENTFSIERIDAAVLSARKAYHKVEDAVSNCLDVSHVQDGSIFDEISIVDFYRYCSVSLDEMYEYLEMRLPWTRPSDTGRSTNCLINDVGIYVHTLERGYHNYSLPYSWDVRLGHKERTAAIDELDDIIDKGYVERVLANVGYQPVSSTSEFEKRLVLYYVTDDPALTPSVLRSQLSKNLPVWMLPVHLMRITSIPLTDNGKVNRAALPAPGNRYNDSRTEYKEPSSELESLLCAVWADFLKIDAVGVDDNYFSIGGDSLIAIRITARLSLMGMSAVLLICLKIKLLRHLRWHWRLEVVTEIQKIKTLALFTSLLIP